MKSIRFDIEKNLKANYGISHEEYDAILTKQKGGCAICADKWIEGTKYFAVDHDHNTGLVRGILCGSCNIALGLLKDDKAIIIQMLTYINKKVSIL